MKIRAGLMIVVLAIASAWAFGTPRQQREFDFVLKRVPSQKEGARLFQACGQCHGVDGVGTADGSIPSISGQHFMVVAKQLVDFRHDVRREARMQHFAGRSHLDFAQQIADVASYVSCLVPRSSETEVPAATRQQGAQLYSRLCERCHRAAGQGEETWLVPRLAGQRYGYLLQQLREPAEQRRPDMARAHSELKKPLSQADAEVLSHYLAGLAPTGKRSACPPKEIPQTD